MIRREAPDFDSLRLIEAEFWPRVNIVAPHLCWEWTGAKTSHGYGFVTKLVRRLSGERSPHRVVALLVGLGGQGPAILHSCDNKLCCNPRHLRRGTQMENLKDIRLAVWMANAAKLRASGKEIRFRDSGILALPIGRSSK